MIPESLYHIYNRGNNKEPIFFISRNYDFFIEKVKTHLLPHVQILAYCLMRNHFHFLVHTREDFDKKSYGQDLKVMLRSYTRAINKQEERTGSLFQQHTKAKPIEDDNQRDRSYPLTCFHYIHQNPLKAGIVQRMEDYKMTSYKEYLDPSKVSICDRQLA